MKPKIMLVEDEVDLGNVVKQYLEIMEFTVDWARDGKAALAKFQAAQGNYDILLIDVSMREMDGFELAIKVININPQVPFLFLKDPSIEIINTRGHGYSLIEQEKR